MPELFCLFIFYISDQKSFSSKNHEMNQKTPYDISPQDLNQWIIHDLSSLILVDVREKEELAIAPFPQKVLHLPFTQFLSWSKTFTQDLPLKKKIVVLCHSGIRSWNFGAWLLEQDCRYQVWNLQGGIDAWSHLIDDSVPRY